MATPTSRLEVALSMLLLLGLPGCVTQALWSAPLQTRVVWEERAADLGIEVGPDVAVAGALSVQAHRLDDHPMPRASGVDQASSQWRLVPEEHAAEAMAVLTAAEGFVVHRTRVDVRRDFMAGDIVCSDAELRLDVGVDWTVVGARVDETLLPPATRSAPRCGRRNDLFETAAAPTWPGLLTRCVEHLDTLDLTPLFPSARHAELETWAWADRDLNILTDRHQVEALCGPGLDDPALGLEERLDKFAALRLLVVVATGTTRATFSLRPDGVWLCGALESDGHGQYVHRSRWHARWIGAITAEEARPEPRAAGTMRVRLFAGREVKDVAEQIGYKILATPFTLAVDFVLALLEDPLAWAAAYAGRKGVDAQ